MLAYAAGNLASPTDSPLQNGQSPVYVCVMHTCIYNLSGSPYCGSAPHNITIYGHITLDSTPSIRFGSPYCGSARRCWSSVCYYPYNSPFWRHCRPSSYSPLGINRPVSRLATRTQARLRHRQARWMHAHTDTGHFYLYMSIPWAMRIKHRISNFLPFIKRGRSMYSWRHTTALNQR